MAYILAVQWSATLDENRFDALWAAWSCFGGILKIMVTLFCVAEGIEFDVFLSII